MLGIHMRSFLNLKPFPQGSLRIKLFCIKSARGLFILFEFSLSAYCYMPISQLVKINSVIKLKLTQSARLIRKVKES